MQDFAKRAVATIAANATLTIKKATMVKEPLAIHLNGHENGPNLVPVESVANMNTSLLADTLWLKTRIRGTQVVLPGLMKFGYVKTKLGHTYRTGEDLSGKPIQVELGGFYDLDHLASGLHQVLVAEAKLAKVLENKADKVLKAAQADVLQQIMELQRAVKAATQAVLDKAVLRPHVGVNIRRVSGALNGLQTEEVAISQKNARKFAKRMRVDSVDGLWVLVIRHPTAEAATARMAKLRICKSKAEVIWFSPDRLNSMGGDCDGDPITVSLLRDREPTFAPPRGELSGPCFDPNGNKEIPEYNYETLSKHEFSNPVDLCVGLMTKNFIGLAFNLFERLAILAVISLPLEKRAEFAARHGFIEHLAGRYNGTDWVQLVTSKVKDSAAAVYEIIMDFRKYVSDDEPERFAVALMAVMGVATGVHRQLDAKAVSIALSKTGQPLLKDGKFVEVEKDGRRINAPLINEILGFINDGSPSVSRFLAKYPFQSLLVGGRRGSEETRLWLPDVSIKALSGLGVDAAIRCLSGVELEAPVVIKKKKGGVRKPSERFVPFYYDRKPKIAEYSQKNLWEYVVDTMNWFDYDKGGPKYKVNVEKYGVQLVLPGVGDLRLYDQFTMLVPKTSAKVGGIRITRRDGHSLFSRCIFRCTNKNVSSMSVVGEQSINNAIRQGDVVLETVLDVIAEGIATACRKNAFLSKFGRGKRATQLACDIKTEIESVYTTYARTAGQTDNEVVDTEVSIILREASIELPGYRNPRIALDLRRRLLSLIDSTEYGTRRVFTNPLNPEVRQRFNVGVTSKNAAGTICTVESDTHSTPAIVGVANLTPGNLDRECRESRTVRFRRALKHGRIVMTNGRENEIPGLLEQKDKSFALDAVWVFVHDTTLLVQDKDGVVINTDQGILTKVGQELYTRERRRPVHCNMSAAAVLGKAREVLGKDATLDSLKEAGWTVTESSREIGRSGRETVYETLYTLIGPEPTEEATWAKIYGFGGHKFVAVPTEEDLFVCLSPGRYAPVAGVIPIESAKKKKLDEAIWAGLCGLYGKRDFSSVSYDSLAAEGAAFLKSNNRSKALPICRKNAAGEMEVYRYGLAGLFRTFVLKEDEALSSCTDISRRPGTGSRSSNMLFTRMIGEAPQVKALDKMHIQVLANLHVKLGEIIVKAAEDFGIDLTTDEVGEILEAAKAARRLEESQVAPDSLDFDESDYSGELDLTADFEADASDSLSGFFD